METNPKRVKPDCLLHRTVKVASKPRWRQLGADEAPKPSRASIRKQLEREHKRAHLVELARVLRPNIGKKGKETSMCEQRTAAAYNRRHPGTMAPPNTTQFLMSNAEEDMKSRNIQADAASTETWSCLYSESLSPSSVYAALDSAYESCVDFQIRDFEEMFAPTCDSYTKDNHEATHWNAARPLGSAPELRMEPIRIPPGTNRVYMDLIRPPQSPLTSAHLDAAPPLGSATEPCVVQRNEPSALPGGHPVYVELIPDQLTPTDIYIGLTGALALPAR
ncbi:unnamed protein product [Pleuronectes platessa]|uniref:Uncharacterized protein n=1 Tax=Pleuronectes platessa TaxID=8262 RepID=A0A9N7YC21_PLEPL|nr:unnamed protein product [Pleuronectes platessa]